MSTIQEQIAQARSAGYDDVAITKHLGTLPDYSSKVKTALDSGYKPTDILSYLENPTAPEGTRANVGAEPDRGLVDKAILKTLKKGGELASLGAGVYKGFGDIVIGGQKLLGKGIEKVGELFPADQNLSSLVTGQRVLNPVEQAGQALTEDAIRRQAMQQQFIKPYKEYAPNITGTGEFGGEVLATLPVGGLIAKPVQMLGKVAPQIASITTPLAQSLRTGGFTTGLIPKVVPGVAPAAVPLSTKIANKLYQTVGGTTVGGTASALVDPAQAESGALVGGILPTVAPPVAKYIAIGLGKFIDATTGNLANVSAGKIAREAAGDQINQIRAANNMAPIDINAAQAAYGINNDIYQAFLAYVSGKDLKSVLSAISTQQGKDQFNILANMARGATEAEAKTSRDLAKETLNKLTTPMREENILAANVGKNVMMPLQQEAELARQAAAANVQDVRRFKGPQVILGQPTNVTPTLLDKTTIAPGAQGRAINPAPTNLATDANLANLANRADEVANKAAAESLAQGEIARTAEAKIANLTANGVQPLNINTVTNRLTALANQVGTRADPIQVTVLTKLKSTLQDLAQANGGIIDANDLYQLRKTGINDVIEAELRSGGLDPSTQSQRIVSLLGEIRPLVDDAIEKAGGKTWRDYLSTYSTGMKQIEQLEMADKLRSLFEKDKNTFVRMVEGNDIKAIQDIFGPGNFDLAKQMAEKMKPLLKIKDEITRNIEIEKQIKAGTKGLSELQELNKRSLSSLLFGFMGRETAATKKGIEILENRLKPKVMAALANAAKSGKSMNEILDTLPADDRFELLKALKEISNVAQAGAASIRKPPPVNALAPEEQNQNALAR